jgi:hypothetical protein
VQVWGQKLQDVLVLSNRSFPRQKWVFFRRIFKKCVAARRSSRFQGCQIFLGTTYQNEKKYTKWPLNMTNGHKIYQLASKYTNILRNMILENLPKLGFLVSKYTNWLQNIPTSYVTWSSKIYPNCDFWFQNIPSGNPGRFAEKNCTFFAYAAQIAIFLTIISYRKSLPALDDKKFEKRTSFLQSFKKVEN